MGTTVYIAGEAGTLGFPIDNPLGEPMDITGLTARMVIYLAGDDLEIDGYWDSGEFLIDGVEITHPSVMAFEIEADTIPLDPRLYRAALQINDGTDGWRTLPGGNINLEVRRP